MVQKLDKIDSAFKHLIEYLDSCPVVSGANFNIEAVNLGRIEHQGLFNTSVLLMDLLILSDNIETRWSIQPKPINFFICKGGIELRFKLTENIHKKMLNPGQSIRIHAGIPFLLRTFESKCELLLIAVKGDIVC